MAFALIPILAWLAAALLVLRQSRPSRTLRESLLVAAVLAALVFLSGWSWCQASFAPPNNIDSVSYHLPRQVFWMQQGSVENYPTSSLRQN